MKKEEKMSSEHTDAEINGERRIYSTRFLEDTNRLMEKLSRQRKVQLKAQEEGRCVQCFAENDRKPRVVCSKCKNAAAANALARGARTKVRSHKDTTANKKRFQKRHPGYAKKYRLKRKCGLRPNQYWEIKSRGQLYYTDDPILAVRAIVQSSAPCEIGIVELNGNQLHAIPTTTDSFQFFRV